MFGVQMKQIDYQNIGILSESRNKHINTFLISLKEENKSGEDTNE